MSSSLEISEHARVWYKIKAYPPTLLTPPTTNCISCNMKQKVYCYSLCHNCLKTCNDPCRFFDMDTKSETLAIL